MSEFLTEKQEAVLKFIEEYQMSYGRSPTLREMRENFGVSSDNGILKHLKALEEKGFIEKDDTPRGIKLLASIKEKLDAPMAMKLPVLGFIPAGGPVLTEEYIENWMSVGDDLVKDTKNYFLLKVTGVSMIDAGIFEGDLVVVDGKREARDGDIVVALVDNHNTLKRYIKREGKTYLKAENKDYKDIYPENELSVQGVVTSLIRQY
ncbi:MAG: transcriptional repressor LexA [Patescibacteria group bacterium]